MKNEKPENRTFSPERLRQARELRGKTQQELAICAGTNQSTIANVENGRFSPSSELLDTIALCLGFQPDFFLQGPPIDFPLGSLILYRPKASVSAREEAKAHRYAQIVFEWASRLAERIKTVPVRLPTVEDTPENAAAFTRIALGLSPNTPIQNLIRAAERAGVMVLTLPVELSDREIDAFSLWGGLHQDKPIVAVINTTFGDRLRLSFAHELGHLVMHRSIYGKLPELEQEAMKFAGAFLLPESAMRDELTVPVTLTSLAAMKPRWGVSIQALIMRAYDIDAISERQKKYLFTRLSALGWRRREPENLDIGVEQPRALPQMAEMLYGRPINIHRMSKDVCLPLSLMQDVLAVSAGGTGTERSGNVVQFPPAKQALTLNNA